MTQLIQFTPFTLTLVCIFSILFIIHFLGADKENLLNNQEIFLLVTIFFIFVTLMCDSGELLQGEIRVKG